MLIIIQGTISICTCMYCVEQCIIMNSIFTVTVTSSKHLSFVEQMNKFYKDVQVERGESSSGGSSPDEQSIPGLTAELRGYQQRGVNWMIEKEIRNDEGAEQPHPLLHMLWKELPTVEHGLPYTVYFNAHSGK